MKHPLAIPVLLDSKLNDLESAFAELHEAAIEESKGSGYSPSFRLLLRIEDLQPRFHKFVDELRGSRNRRAAA